MEEIMVLLKNGVTVNNALLIYAVLRLIPKIRRLIEALIIVLEKGGKNERTDI